MTTHTCYPAFDEMGIARSVCAEVIKVDGVWTRCGVKVVRILHGPGHVLAGRPCGFPDTWAHCWITAERAALESSDLLTVPEWKER